MKFKILLENRKNGDKAVIEMPARARLESISPKIKVAFHLPYTDNARHRYILRGATYVPEEHIISEEEMQWEAGLRPGIYRCSDDIPISRAFTSLGSAFLYMQDEFFWGDYQVRCTLIGRIG
ncbi:MAG: hypothetical protein IJT97_05540 [Bacteroidaceae bacterium]|nr:hypothetical protein [Bacteroidaceae bacterium]